jgi:CubicO group peptidase (beta-lactamase class C family)
MSTRVRVPPSLLLLVAGLLLPIVWGGCGTPRETTTDEPGRFEMAAEYSRAKDGRALLVWKDGDRLVEAYQNGYHPDSASSARLPLVDGSALHSGLVALALADDGLLALDDPVATVLPQWKDDPARSGITTAQLLHGTSGLRTALRKPRPPQKAVEQPLVHAPGTSFRYGATAFQAFGHVAYRATQDAYYLRDRILRRLNIEGGYWTRAEGGDGPNWAYGSHLTPHEWERIGRMILHEGSWKGDRILANVDRLGETTAASPGFGLGVWVNRAVDLDDSFFDRLPTHYGRHPLTLTPDGPSGWIYKGGPNDLMMAAGGGGQRLYIVPSRDLVVVRLGQSTSSWNDAEFLARLLDGRAYDVRATETGTGR